MKKKVQLVVEMMVEISPEHVAAVEEDFKVTKPDKPVTEVDVLEHAVAGLSITATSSDPVRIWDEEIMDWECWDE